MAASPTSFLLASYVLATPDLRISVASARAVNSSERLFDLWSHSSAFDLHWFVSSSRKAVSASLSSISSPFFFSRASFSADFSADNCSFSALLFSLNFFSFANPNTFFSLVVLASNSAVSASFLFCTKEVLKSRSSSITLFDWYLYVAACPGVFAVWRRAAAACAVISGIRIAKSFASCVRACWLSKLPPTAAFDACNAFMAASTAAIAPVTFLSAVKYARCSSFRVDSSSEMSVSSWPMRVPNSTTSSSSAEISSPRTVILAPTSSIFSSDFSIAYVIESTCSLQKHANLS
mmetsp:Transcript_19079/g.38562  ORF Transcript_19079/g.38562 Transcript_19079/m.38562 type:complete len:292 (-) Transcript_19079:167-1042(-)